MKKQNFGLISTILLICTMGFTMNSCSDYGYGGDYGEDDSGDGGGDGRVLDPNLYGTWAHVSSTDTAYWTYKSNGDCIQTSHGKDYDWLWEIENAQIKIYVTNGTPFFYTYKIEGNKLFFWADWLDAWALPYTKE